MALVDAAHWATEAPWLDAVAAALREQLRHYGGGPGVPPGHRSVDAARPVTAEASPSTHVNADTATQLRLLDLQAADTALAQLAHRRAHAARAGRARRARASGGRRCTTRSSTPRPASSDIAAEQRRLENDVDTVRAAHGARRGAAAGRRAAGQGARGPAARDRHAGPPAVHARGRAARRDGTRRGGRRPSWPRRTAGARARSRPSSSDLDAARDAAFAEIDAARPSARPQRDAIAARDARRPARALRAGPRARRHRRRAAAAAPLRGLPHRAVRQRARRGAQRRPGRGRALRQLPGASSCAPPSPACDRGRADVASSRSSSRPTAGRAATPGRPATARSCSTRPRGEVLAERSEAIGIATNNVAEYRGLIAGLEAARELGARARRGADGLQARRRADEGHAGRSRTRRCASSPARRPRCGSALRRGHLRMDPARAEHARRPAGQRGDGPRRRQAGPTRRAPAAAAPAAPAWAPPTGTADPADAGAARRDRALGRAALLRPQRPAARRGRAAAGRGAGRRAPFGARRRGRQLTAARAPCRPPRRSPPGSGSTVEIDRRPGRDRLRRVGGPHVRRGPGRATRPRSTRGSARPTSRRPAASRSPRSAARVRRAREQRDRRPPRRSRRRGRQPRHADQDAAAARARRAAVGDVPHPPRHRVGVDRRLLRRRQLARCGWSTTPVTCAERRHRRHA